MVTISPWTTDSITLSSTTLNIPATSTGETLTARISGVSSTALPMYSVKWESINERVATVSSSETRFTADSSQVSITVVPVSAGSTRIRATLYYGDRQITSGTCDVTVGGVAGDLTLNSSTLSLTNSGTSTSYGQVSALLSGVSSAELSKYSVLWTTSDYTTAYLNDNGSVSRTTTTSFTGTSGNYYTSPVVIYAGSKTGRTTVTAQLYYDNEPVRGESATVTVTVGSNFDLVAVSPSNTSAVYLNSYWSSSTSGYYCDFTADPRLNGYSIQSSSSNRDYDTYYVWKLNGYTVQSYNVSGSSNSPSYRLYASNEYLNRYLSTSNRYNTLTCEVWVYDHNATVGSNYRFNDSVTWNVYTDYYSDFSVGVTVYDSNPGYDLMDTPDEGNTGSIADQIDNWVRRYYGYGSSSSSTYRDYRVRVYGGTAYETGSSGNRGTLTNTSSWYYYSDLDDIVFTPGSTVSTSTGYYRISFNFDVELYYYSGTSSGNTVRGTMTFTVKQGTASGGDINYSAAPGADVTFKVSDFQNFWNNIYSSGSLSYVTFGSHSGGTVRTSSGTAVTTGSSGTQCAVSPSSRQTALEGVYFDTSSSRSTTVRIPFTATGTTSRSGSSVSRSGYVVITYLSAAAKAVTYTTNTSGLVSLKADDFITAYRSATGKSDSPSNLTIEFQGVPSYGTLTYTGGSRDVKLTSSNIKNYRFAARTSGSNQIGDVTYSVSGNRTETISYVGYVGGTATFTGDVTFNAVTAPTDVKVSFTCYQAAGVPLTASYFTAANSAMGNATYIILGTPRLGTIKNPTGAANSAILMSSLSTVTYVPNSSLAGTSTTDSFVFTAYNSANQVVASGTVNVVIALPAAPSNPNAITNINQFTDIPANAYYTASLTYLINKGVINGQGGGKFGPDANLDYSQALKFIMNAAGYYEAELSGANWALNYKNKAVQNGWLDSSVELTAAIPRVKMAELAAKVLGIPASTQASPFSDTTNPYAVALYYTTPQIIQGQTSGAKPVFNENQTLKRHEMISLVYRMYQYVEKQSG